MDVDLSCVRRLVLPKSRRALVSRLAHDHTGHFGCKKMRVLINHRFTWPGLAKDCLDYAASCEECLKYNKAGHKQAMMIERPIIMEPNEVVAIDIVGPLPKGKGGAKYLLTCICLASRWPDAIPMRTASAGEVAEALLSIFSGTGLPLWILTGQGQVFMGYVMLQLCNLLGVDLVHTTPYRPQTNGVIERLHGTLKPILAKAKENGLDWVKFLPMALYAIRQSANRDIGFSPYELVFGTIMRGPLDVLYAGWVEDVYKEVDVSDWVVTLKDRLQTLHECAYKNGLVSSGKRKEAFDRGKVDRNYELVSRF